MKSLLFVLYFVVNGNLFATININQCDGFPNVRDVCFLPSGDAEKSVNMILAGDTVIVFCLLEMLRSL